MSVHHILSFATLLGDIGDGYTNVELTEIFNSFLTRLGAHADLHGGAKGELALKFTLGIDRHGKVTFDVATPSITLPKSKLAGSTYFLDKGDDGEVCLSRRNPKQADMFEDSGAKPREIRDGGAKPREIRDTPAPLRAVAATTPK